MSHFRYESRDEYMGWIFLNFQLAGVRSILAIVNIAFDLTAQMLDIAFE